MQSRVFLAGSERRSKIIRHHRCESRYERAEHDVEHILVREVLPRGHNAVKQIEDHCDKREGQDGGDPSERASVFGQAHLRRARLLSVLEITQILLKFLLPYTLAFFGVGAIDFEVHPLGFLVCAVPFF